MAVYTNRWYNSEFTGAVVGVIGAGGTLPGGWSTSTTGGGITYTWEITSFTAGTSTSAAIIRVKMTAVNASGGDAFPLMNMGNFSVSAATLYQFSAWCRYISQSGARYFGPSLSEVQSTSGGGYISNANRYSLTNTLAQGVVGITTSGTTGLITPYMGWGFATGVTVTDEIEITMPMWVDGATNAPGYIPTVDGTPVTRSFLAPLQRPGPRAISLLLR